MGKKQETGITGVENNINLEKNSNIIKRIVVFMFMFALSGVIAWLGSVLYHIQTDMMIRNIVMVLTGSGIVIFSYVMGETLREICLYLSGKSDGGGVSAVFAGYRLAVSGVVCTVKRFLKQYDGISRGESRPASCREFCGL